MTADLIPRVTVVVYQDGESAESQDVSTIGDDESEIAVDMSVSYNENSSEGESVDETDSGDFEKISE